jgi:hypothetical protein
VRKLQSCLHKNPLCLLAHCPSLFYTTPTVCTQLCCIYQLSTFYLLHNTLHCTLAITMSETARLIGMLKESATQRIRPAQPLDFNLLEDPAVVSVKTGQNHYRGVYQVPRTFSEALHFVADGKPLPPPPNAPLGQEFQPRLDFVIITLNKITVNTISKAKMAGRLPALSTSDLPAASPSEASATASPARGTAMLNSIFKSVRVPEFKYRWQFWAEKGQQQPPAKTASSTAGAEEYANRPKPLGEHIVSVKDFYQHFNNIPVESLKLRDSIHLFHLGVKPLWEDPRNTRGGAWYFRISKEQAAQFWHEVCLLAVGDVLQGAVETKRACEYVHHTKMI